MVHEKKEIAKKERKKERKKDRLAVHSSVNFPRRKL